MATKEIESKSFSFSIEERHFSLCIDVANSGLNGSLYEVSSPKQNEISSYYVSTEVSGDMSKGKIYDPVEEIKRLAHADAERFVRGEFEQNQAEPEKSQ